MPCGYCLHVEGGAGGVGGGVRRGKGGGGWEDWMGCEGGSAREGMPGGGDGTQEKGQRGVESIPLALWIKIYSV